LTLSPAMSNESHPYSLDSEERDSNLELHGKLQYSHLSYFESNPNSEVDNLQDGRILFDISWAVGPFALFTIVEDYIRNADTVDRNDLLFKELYIDWRPESDDMNLPLLTDLFFRTGIQIISWGSGILYNPTDNLTPSYSVDPFDPQDRGIPAIKLSLASGLNTLDMIWLTAFEATELPRLHERFFIHRPTRIHSDSTTYGLNYVDTDQSDLPSTDFSNGQFASRFYTTLKGWELAISYFNGYENIPVFEAEIISVDPVQQEMDAVVNYIHPKQHVFGIDLSGYIGRLGIHTENAYFNMEDTGRDVGAGDENYLTCLVGISYPFNDVIDTQDFNITLEYVKEFNDSETDNRIFINRVYKDSILFRLVHTYNHKVTGELNYISNFDTKGKYLHASYDYQYSDHVRFSAGFELFYGDEISFFGAYDSNERFFLTTVFEF
jgi:hypothetical protein